MSVKASFSVLHCPVECSSTTEDGNFVVSSGNNVSVSVSISVSVVLERKFIK